MPILKKVNRSFFKTWTPDMAYVLGFFMADGSMNKNTRGAYFFNIQICDRALLYAIRSILGSNHKVSVRPAKGNDSPKYRLQIGSFEICKDLQELGLQFNKARNLSMPVVPPHLFGHFIRGYFDGDGNIWSGFVHKDRPVPLRVLFAGFTSCSKGFLESLQKKLKERRLGRGSLVSYNSNAYYRLQYATRDSFRLAGLMYEDHTPRLYLKRKKDIFDRFILRNMRA